MTNNTKTTNTKTTQSAPHTLQDLLAPLQESVDLAKAQVEKVLETSQQTATRTYEQALSLSRNQAVSATNVLVSGYDELATLTRAHYEATSESASIAAKGFETLGQEAVSFARQQVDAQAEFARKLMGARSLKDVFEVQAEATRRSVDTVMSHGAKVADLSVNHANEALAPIQSQATATFAKANNKARAAA